MNSTRNIISTNNISKNMKNNTLNNLTKDELINLVLNQNQKIKKLFEIINEQKRPIPAPRKNVKQMIQSYEENIIPPPLEFRDKPIPAPRKNVKQMIQSYEDNIIQSPIEFSDDYKPTPKPRTIKPVLSPRTKIEEKAQAMQGYTKSYEINIINKKDPLEQLKNTRKAVEHHVKNIIESKKGLKFVETLKVTFTKMSGNEIIYKSAYFNSKPHTIINNVEISGSLQLSEQQILNLVAVWISEGSGWTVESVDSHYLNIVKYEPLKGSSYITLPTELRNSSKGLVNMKNKDHECFRWCHIRHLNPQNKDPQKNQKS